MGGRGGLLNFLRDNISQKRISIPFETTIMLYSESMFICSNYLNICDVCRVMDDKMYTYIVFIRVIICPSHWSKQLSFNFFFQLHFTHRPNAVYSFCQFKCQFGLEPEWQIEKGIYPRTRTNKTQYVYQTLSILFMKGIDNHKKCAHKNLLYIIIIIIIE